MNFFLNYFKNWNFRWTALCIILISLSTMYFFGCEPTTSSIFDPNRKVTMEELQAEVELYLTIANSRARQLDQQLQVRDFVLNNLALYSQSGNINPVSLLPSLLGLFGIGATIENVRVRKKFALQKQDSIDS